MAASLLGLSLVGCGSYEPFEPPATDDIRPGAGLFSGESGEFVIYRGGGSAPGRSRAPEAATGPADGVLPPDRENRPARTP